MVSRLRFPLLALGLASLAAGVWGGLTRFGWDLPGEAADVAELHGPLLVFGFLGTVIGLERAVALRRAWGYLAPAGTLAGTALLLLGAPERLGQLALAAAGLVLAGLFVVVLRAHATAAVATLFLGTLTWVTGTLLWLGGLPLVQVVPWWGAFLVLTIVGERLELAALGRLTRRGRASFLAVTGALVAGLALSGVADGAGVRVAGAALAAYAVWLARFDVARHTVRRPGLPRFVALALLPGYVWLAVAGVLWLWHGAVAAGPVHDAELHALFVGFVFSMIFGHAPVIFPGLLGVAVPFRRVFYVHLALLHAGLVLRVAGDLLERHELARDGSLVNAAAIALFLVATVGSAAVARVRR